MHRAFHTNRKPQPQRGFIALMSMIILSFVLLDVTMTANTSSMFARLNTLNSEYKRISLGLAESCVNKALLTIAENYSYTPAPGGDVILVGSNFCTIKELTYGPEDPLTYQKVATIKTEGEYRGAFSNITTTATVPNPHESLAQGVLFIVTQVTH